MSRLTENLKTLEEMGKLNRYIMNILENSLEEHEKEIRNKAISEFAERMCDRSCEESFRAVINGVPYDILTQDAVADLAWEIEKELKGGSE